MENQTLIAPYASVIIKLLQGVLEADDLYWKDLEKYQPAVRDYFGKIGIRLYLDQEEGYAYLDQIEDQDLEEQNQIKLPRLVARHPLSYELTILCVILREELQRFDLQEKDSIRCILTKAEIYDLVEPFFPERNNELKRRKNIDAKIKQAVDMGFLKELKQREETDNQVYEVRRIIKARIPAEKLGEIKEKLKNYAAN